MAQRSRGAGWERAVPGTGNSRDRQFQGVGRLLSHPTFPGDSHLERIYGRKMKALPRACSISRKLSRFCSHPASTFICAELYFTSRFEPVRTIPAAAFPQNSRAPPPSGAVRAGDSGASGLREPLPAGNAGASGGKAALTQPQAARVMEFAGTGCSPRCPRAPEVGTAGSGMLRDAVRCSGMLRRWAPIVRA